MCLHETKANHFKDTFTKNAYIVYISSQWLCIRLTDVGNSMASNSDQNCYCHYKRTVARSQFTTQLLYILLVHIETYIEQQQQQQQQSIPQCRPLFQASLLRLRFIDEMASITFSSLLVHCTSELRSFSSLFCFLLACFGILIHMIQQCIDESLNIQLRPIYRLQTQMQREFLW